MNCRISKTFQISNEPIVNLIISTTCGDREGKKKETPLQKNVTFQIWIYPLLNLKSIHHAPEFCYKYRIEV